MKLSMIDLFAGAGGLTLGLTTHGGFQPQISVDNDQAACDTHRLNFPDCQTVCANVETWLASCSEQAVDVAVGGPPCQGFSLLNKSRDGDLRRSLFIPYFEVLRRFRVRTFLMENVPGLLTSPEMELIRELARRLDYSIVAKVLNAADYGVPQQRKRTIIIGMKNQVPYHPEPTHSSDATLLSQPWRTVREAIGDLPAPTGTEPSDVAPPQNLHFGRSPSPTSLLRYQAVPPGGNRFDLQRNRPDITPQCWINKKTGSTDVFGRLWWDRPAVTIRTEFYKPEKGRYLHPNENRPITHREAARLQTFPDSFLFAGSKIAIAKQIGNAVPITFAQALANSIYSQLLK